MPSPPDWGIWDMDNDRFVMKSKMYIPPSKGSHVLVVILNICLIVVVLTSLFAILMNGINMSSVGIILISVFVVASLKRKKQDKDEYEFCYVELDFEPEALQIVYLDPNQHNTDRERKETVTFLYRDITTLEYSDQLEGLRICGSGQKRALTSKKKETQIEEHLLYVDPEKKEALLGALSEKINVPVRYMDRADLQK